MIESSRWPSERDTLPLQKHRIHFSCRLRGPSHRVTDLGSWHSAESTEVGNTGTASQGKSWQQFWPCSYETVPRVPFIRLPRLTGRTSEESRQGCQDTVSTAALRSFRKGAPPVTATAVGKDFWALTAPLLCDGYVLGRPGQCPALGTSAVVPTECRLHIRHFTPLLELCAFRLERHPGGHVLDEDQNFLEGTETRRAVVSRPVATELQCSLRIQRAQPWVACNSCFSYVGENDITTS